MKILNFGSCNIDYVYDVDHIVLPGETISAKNLEFFPGGKGLNQSIAAARAGGNVYHAGCIGNDGQMLHDVLEDSGVNLSYLKKLDSQTGHAIIQLDKSGQNCIFVYKGTNGMIDENFIDEVLQNFSSEDMLLIQNEINNIHYLIDKAYERKIKVVFNPSPFNDELKTIDLNKIYCLILNEVEANGFCEGDKPEKIIENLLSDYPKLHIMLTLGERGCIYADSTQILRHPIFEVKVVDTTAAGDTFTGYFISSILAGKSYDDAIKYASAASALAVSRKGAATSIPKLEEVEESLKTLKEHISSAKPKAEYRQLIDYISNNLKNVSLKELADMMGYSTAYASAYVKRVLGISFIEAVQRERCRAAAELIEKGEASISEIIRQVGYENESFFRKKFKEIYGKSPLEYRKTEK